MQVCLKGFPSTYGGICSICIGDESAQVISPGADKICKGGHPDKDLVAWQGSAQQVLSYRKVLQECMRNKDLAVAKRVHADIATNGLESHRILGELVVTTLVKCGSLEDGLDVFQRLPHRTVFSWTAIIAGYSNAGQWHEALSCYDQMVREGVQIDKYTAVSLLKACSRLEDLEKGKRIHAEVLRRGLEADTYVGSTLVSMYAKCGSIVTAQLVFDTLSKPDAVSWNAMLAAYAQQEQGEKTLQTFEQMLEQGVLPDARTFVSVLQACGGVAEKEEKAFVDGQRVKVESLQVGKGLHAAAASRGFESDLFVGNSLVTMYAKCGSIMDVEQVFRRLSERDVVSWNAMIAAYAEQDEGEKALHIFRKMQEQGIKPDARTFVSSLQACGALAEKEEGTTLADGHNVKLASLWYVHQIHAEAASGRFLSNSFVASTLVSLYAKCGRIKDAKQVFDGLSYRNVVSWNAMLAAYAQQGQGELALQLYDKMLGKGIRPNPRTFVSCLQACGSVAEQEDTESLQGQASKESMLQKGKKLHADAATAGFGSDVFVGNTLVSMYAKCGSIKEAQRLFDQLTCRDVVSWNAMIAAYAHHEQGEQALQIFAEMQKQGVKSDEATFLSALEACSSTGALAMCVLVHRHMMASGVRCSLPLATSLIHAYGKCGNMGDAQTVFESLPQPDVVTWNALIAGYARQGRCEMTAHCFEQMCLAGLRPNSVTFLALLSACSHGGMVDEGVEYFESMTRDYGVGAEVEHYVCMIDLFGRAGLFRRVEGLLGGMPIQPNLSLWLCLLGACRKHGNVELGRHAFEQAVCLDPKQASAYVLMSNIYAMAGELDSASEIDGLRLKARAWKPPGQSWIEHEQQVHKFMAGDQRHRQEAMLCKALQELCSGVLDAETY